MDEHRLAWYGRETGSQFNSHLGQLRFQSRADQDSLLGAGRTIGCGHHHGIITGLGRARNPYKLTGLRVEGCAFGQAFGPVCQYGVQIRVRGIHKEPQLLSQCGPMVGGLQHRHTVDIGDTQDDIDGVHEAFRIQSGEANCMSTRLLVSRCPGEGAGVLIKSSSIGHTRQCLVDQSITVHVTSHDAEFHRRSLASGHGRHGH